MNEAQRKIAENIWYCVICGHPLEMPRRYVYTCGHIHEGILRRRQEENRRRAERFSKK